MITTCQYLGIYVDEIENACEQCEDAMERLGFSIDEIDDMNEYAKEELDEILHGIDGITNAIIGAYYRATEYMIHEKYPNLGVSYYVDGFCSSIDVDELEKLDEDEIREDWEHALETMNYSDIASAIGWGFYNEDLQKLMELHKQNKYREKIEDLLEDCNFHTECGNWSEGNYIIEEDE